MLLGSPLVAIGGCEAVSTKRELSRATRTRGTVVENRLVVDVRDGVEEHAYRPVVEFRDASGRRQRFTDAVASLPPDYSTGQTVDIAFDARAPHPGRIVSWKRLWLVPSLLSAVGLMPSLVCAILFRRLSR